MSTNQGRSALFGGRTNAEGRDVSQNNLAVAKRSTITGFYLHRVRHFYMHYNEVTNVIQNFVMANGIMGLGLLSEKL